MFQDIQRKENNYNLREGARRSYVSFNNLKKQKKNKALIKKQKRISIKKQLDQVDTSGEMVLSNDDYNNSKTLEPFSMVLQKIQFSELFDQDSNKMFYENNYSKPIDLFEYLLYDRDTIDFNM